MPSLTRRDAVRAGVLSLVGLAGCTGSSSSDPEHVHPRLDRVRVGNWLSEPVSLDLQLELDDEVVFWRDVSIRGTNADPDAPGESSVHGPVFTPPAFPREHGKWLVRGRVRGTHETYETLFTNETTAESCLDIGVHVRRDGIQITYVATHDCNPVTTTSQPD